MFFSFLQILSRKKCSPSDESASVDVPVKRFSDDKPYRIRDTVSCRLLFCFLHQPRFHICGKSYSYPRLHLFRIAISFQQSRNNQICRYFIRFSSVIKLPSTIRIESLLITSIGNVIVGDNKPLHSSTHFPPSL